MNKEVRAIIVDDTEIMTSLTAVEIADRLRTYDDLKDEVNRKDNIINELEKYHIKSMKNLENTEEFKYVGINHIKILYEEHKRTLEKLKELKESGNNE